MGGRGGRPATSRDSRQAHRYVHPSQPAAHARDKVALRVVQQAQVRAAQGAKDPLLGATSATLTL